MPSGVSAHVAQTVRSKLDGLMPKTMRELQIATGLSRPTIYKALQHLDARKDDTYYPPTYTL